MQIHEIRDLSNQQLQEELESSYKELMNLRFRAATMQLSNVNEISRSRKRIARINTVLRERELAASLT